MTLFDDKWASRWEKGGRFCGGLDPDWDRIPEQNKERGARRAISSFCRETAESISEYVAAFKANLGFFLAQGSEGVAALEALCRHLKHYFPDTPIILDAKSNDIGLSAAQYAHFAFDVLGADAMTANGYLGDDSLEPFFKKYPDRTIFVLCRTSNPGAGKYQNLQTFRTGEPWNKALPLYARVANDARVWNKKYGNCGLVVGATAPDELASIRRIVGDDIPLLLPGIGTQGGDLNSAVRNGMNDRGRGFVINVGSSIMFASNPRGEAEKMRDNINHVLG